MEQHRKRTPIILGLPAIAVLLTTACATIPAPRVVSWDHQMLPSEFHDVDGEEYLLLRIEDERFNTTDMFSVYEIGDDGLSPWTGYFSAEAGTFFSVPMYNNGYMEWFAHPVSRDVVAGRTLRFFRVSAE